MLQKIIRYLHYKINYDYIVQKLIFRPTCNIGSGTELHSSARIRNGRKLKNCIIIGSNTIIKGELLTFKHGGEITIGDWCYVGENTRIWSGLKIKIGNRTLISHGVNIFDNLTHPIDYNRRHMHYKEMILMGHPSKIDLSDKEVIIGDDVLIGANAIILRGITIGNKSIVGAGSVVTKNIPEMVIVAGNPARIIRNISAEELS